ncbi:MAG: DUF5666 domain-containing protein, partial [Candidatus Competibacterales bacterium]|nr:DUF5666 domain-containing protein [Candidatus Competibacterales bacterium]
GLLGLAMLGCGSGTQGDLSGTGFHKRGEVSGFGSVIVDGEAFATDSASFEIDGQAGSEAALEVGMIVTLEVDADGNLQVLEFDSTLTGPVEAIGENSLTVAGQTVLVDALTTFEQGDLEDVQHNARVRISAYAETAETLRASFVGAADSAQTDLQGRVAALDTAAQRFRLGAATVDYSQAGEFAVADDLRNGDLVAVSGEYDADSRLLTAQSLAMLDRVPTRQAGRQLEWSGLVSNPGDGGFQLDDLIVRFDADARFERGDADDLAAGSKVTVSGAFAPDGVLEAEQIRLQPAVTVEFEAQVESVDADNGTITMLNGQVVSVAVDARLRDASVRSQRRFTPQSIQSGDRVVVSGFESGERVIALRVERRDADADNDGEADQTRIRGQIRSLDEESRQVALPGATVQLDDDTAFEGYADEADFFQTAQVGDEVTAEGDYDSNNQVLRAAVITAEGNARSSGAAGPP